MQISLNWLKNYVPYTQSSQEIAQLLTQAGLEVEQITEFSFLPKGLLIGQVVTCTPHPNATRLQITQVDVGEAEILQIVCGAPNVAAGQKVIVAPVGTVLPAPDKPFVIQKTKIRGEASHGMLCANEEIGLSSDASGGIAVLETDLAPGTPLHVYYNTPPDTILHIGITPNRGDACSHLGVARELRAILDLPITLPKFTNLPKPAAHLPMQVTVADYPNCPRYAGIVLQNIRVQESPIWLQNKLTAIGVAPVNNVVDVANFVLHDLGQPLHVLDYDCLPIKQLCVQNAQAGAQFLGLDNQTYTLTGEELAITDPSGEVLYLAGVLGGKSTAVTHQTTTIYIESAYFSPEAVRTTAKRHGIATASSFRFERSTDQEMVEKSLQYACNLILEIMPAQIASPIISSEESTMEELVIPLSDCQHLVRIAYADLERLAGESLPKETVHAIAHRLDVGIGSCTENQFLAKIPSYRQYYLEDPIDVMAEILRIYGYNRLLTQKPLGTNYLAATTPPKAWQLTQKVATYLAANGYQEINTNPLINQSHLQRLPNLQDSRNVAILNPTSEACNVLQPTLLLSGLETIAYNLNRGQSSAKLFTFGKIYAQPQPGVFTEKERLGIWLTGQMQADNWHIPKQMADVSHLKAMVSRLLLSLGITQGQTKCISHDWYSQAVGIYAQDNLLLTVGQVIPKCLQTYDLTQPVFFADIDWENLLQHTVTKGTYQPIAKFPAVRRDLSIIIPKTLTWEYIVQVLAKHRLPLVQNMQVVDMYTGNNLPEGKKTYTIAFTLQSAKGTLQDKEIQTTMQKLMQVLEQEAGAWIRKEK